MDPRVDFNPARLRLNNLLPPNSMGQDFRTPPFMPQLPQLPQVATSTPSGPMDYPEGDMPSGAGESPSGEREPAKYEKPLHHEVADKFLEFLDKYPEKPKSPGLMGNIAGAFASFVPNATPDDVDKSRFGGYYRQRDEWKERAGVMGQAAQLERANNQTDSLDEYRQDTIREREETRRARSEAATEDRKIKQQNADTAARRAEIQAAALEGGTIVHDSVTGRSQLLNKKGQLKDVDLKALTFEQQVALRTAGQLIIANDSQGAARELAALKQKYDLEKIEADKKAKLETDAANARNKQDNPESGASEKAKLQIRIQQYVREHPTHSDWLEENETSGAVTMSPKIHWWDSESVKAEKQKAIKGFNEFVRGAAAASPGDTVIPGGNTGSVAPGSRFNKTQIIMLAPDGKTKGTVSSEAEAKRLEGLKPPYTRVK